jgi:cell division protein FtsQ
MIIKVLKIISQIALLIALFVLLGFALNSHKENQCKSYQIEIDYSNDTKLVTKAEVEEILGDSIIGHAIKSINISSIENQLQGNPYILKADVFVNIKGEMSVKILQREPLFRLIDNTNKSFYVDPNGNIFSNNKNKAARVLLVNGNVPKIVLAPDKIIEKIDSLKSDRLNTIFEMCKLIKQDDFLEAQIEQIYINGDNFELIPKLGKHYIEFGAIENMEKKLENLKYFYTKGLQNKDWNQYKKVSLKFNNQIVCTK